MLTALGILVRVLALGVVAWIIVDLPGVMGSVQSLFDGLMMPGRILGAGVGLLLFIGAITGFLDKAAEL